METSSTGGNRHILGLSAFYHDAGACLLRDGVLVAACQEERFSRRKHDPDFPVQAARSCLEQGGITVEDVGLAVFYDKPILKFDRLLETYLAVAPRGFRSFRATLPGYLNTKLDVRRKIKRELGYRGKILFAGHHQSHAASAFFPSPFEKAAYLTVDGVGEWTTTSFGVGEGNRLRPWGEIHFPHSLGLLYSAFTHYLGFRVNFGEYKLMGLAPYGEPVYADRIREKLVSLNADGSLYLHQEYFSYMAGLAMTNRRFARLFGGPPRTSEGDIAQRHMDLARSVQVVAEEAMLRLAQHVAQQTGQENLCLAGGVALNCVANGRLLREGPFRRLWIQPAAGDAGGALGACFAAWHQYLGEERRPVEPDGMRGGYLGPAFSTEEVCRFLETQKIPARALSRREVIDETARLIADGRVVGWFQGPMEFGPRALGARSILGDPRSASMQRTMNLKIKFRESFRPFAPSCLLERTSEYFDLDVPSPYMLLVAAVGEAKRRELDAAEEAAHGLDKLAVVRSEIPAVTHVDATARIQTVTAASNPLYHDMIQRFEELTGCPLVINTSFNVRGEPIVCTPRDAYDCFMKTAMDDLVLESFLLTKEKQPEERRASAKKEAGPHALD